ncbi:hypothetical protein Nepgr_027670 [Nepenthes gracilis]|uniref:RING-type E3 ubiquitin transferase n=1 Tax=Nepenthes gracilis TaxID=150966 RepID=A0AAD3Y1E8_NEPGR|nr:hypothetical protein Nepgr_027670 [Nepenthes gracilis]
MAKSGVLEGNPATVSAAAAAEKAMELKRELKRMVKAIVKEDDVSLDVIDRAKEALLALKDLKMRRTASLKVGDDHESILSSCPERFRCPLSKQLMRDPVIIATGQTYDRHFIQGWLKAGNRTCPVTQQVLSHTLLTPNTLVMEMISEWYENRGIKFSNAVHCLNEDGVTKADQHHFFSLIQKMSSTILEQKSAAKELRLLTKKIPSYRALFGESADAIPQLLRPLSQRTSRDEIHPDLQEDLVTTLLNLSIHDSNKKLVAETPMVIPLLVDALKCGTIQTRSNAAAALFTLSALDSNKALIGKVGALGPLTDLLDEGHPLAVKDAASAIFNLCILHENKARAVREGGVSVIMKKIRDNSHVDELLSILAILSTDQTAVEELSELGALPCLLGIIRETPCSRNKENCIAILYAICMNNRIKLREMREEENAYGTLSRLARDGTSRAKRKANGILERLNRAVNLTHTA